MSRRVRRGTVPGQPPRMPFALIDELSCYYDTRSEPNNVHLEVLVPGPVDYLTLRRAVARALASAPRARCRMADGPAFRCRYTWEFPPGPDVDPVSHVTWADEGELAAVRARFLASSPPLRTSPPVRLLLASGSEASCVMLNAHHAAMDGISGLELLRDIAARYRAITTDLGHPAAAVVLPAVSGLPGAAQTLRAHTPPIPSNTVPLAAIPPDPLPAGSLPAGALPPDAVSAGVLPSGALASGARSPGGLPSATLRQGALPAGGLPPGARPPGTLPPGTVPPSGAVPPGTWLRALVPVLRYPAARIAPDREETEQRDGYGICLLPVAGIPRAPGSTVNDTLITALIATISRWNTAHRRRPRTISITVPVNVRGVGLRGVAGNHSRIAKVTIDPRTAAGDLPLLLAAVTSQTSAIRRARPERASAGGLGRAPGWCPVMLKRLAVRFALRAIGRIVCDTCMLTNLGNVADPPWSGYRGPVRMALSGPAHMPRGVSVGALTADGRLQLGFRYRHALFGEEAAARFTATYAAALAELTGGAGPQRREERTKEEIPVILHEALLKLLVCPVDKGSLIYFADENLLYNPRLRRAYRIEGGIPVMLAERAEPVQEREHERLISLARDGAAALSGAGRAPAVPAESEEAP